MFAFFQDSECSFFGKKLRAKFFEQFKEYFRNFSGSKGGKFKSDPYLGKELSNLEARTLILIKIVIL